MTLNAKRRRKSRMAEHMARKAAKTMTQIKGQSCQSATPAKAKGWAR